MASRKKIWKNFRDSSAILPRLVFDVDSHFPIDFRSNQCASDNQLLDLGVSVFRAQAARIRFAVMLDGRISRVDCEFGGENRQDTIVLRIVMLLRETLRLLLSLSFLRNQQSATT